MDRKLFGLAAGAGVCELGAGGEAGASGDELPGPLYPDEDSADVHQVESGGRSLQRLKELIETALETYRAEYAEYYKKHALKDSPAMRDASPTVVLVPGVGMFSFGKNKTEARITGEFYINAIGVMQGAGALGAGVNCTEIPQAGPAASADQFTMYANYVALPPSEAFRIEYWKLEEAKIRRQPPEKELSRQGCAGCRRRKRDWA